MHKSLGNIRPRGIMSSPTLSTLFFQQLLRDPYIWNTYKFHKFKPGAHIHVTHVHALEHSCFCREHYCTYHRWFLNNQHFIVNLKLAFTADHISNCVAPIPLEGTSCYDLGLGPTKFLYPPVTAMPSAVTITLPSVQPAIQPSVPVIPSSFITTIPQIPIMWPTSHTAIPEILIAWPTSHTCQYLSMEYTRVPLKYSSQVGGNCVMIRFCPHFILFFTLPFQSRDLCHMIYHLTGHLTFGT